MSNRARRRSSASLTAGMHQIMSVVLSPHSHRHSLVSIVNLGIDHKRETSKLECMFEVTGVGEYVLSFLTTGISTPLREVNKWCNWFVSTSCIHLRFRAGVPEEQVLNVLYHVNQGLHKTSRGAKTDVEGTIVSHQLHQGACSSLRTIQFTDYKGKIPEEIGEHRTLKRIVLAGVEQFPEWLPIALASTLQSLKCTQAKIFEIPQTITNMTGLRALDLSRSVDSRGLPDWFGRGMTSLEQLTLRQCGIRELPDGIVEMVKLKELDLTQNLLTYLPEWISDLKRLEKLSVRHNMLASLPQSFSCLENLKELSLHVDRFTTLDYIGRLPEFFGTRFTKLTKLNLSGCRLTTIPSQLMRLQELQELNLGNNPNLVTIPNIVEGNWPKLSKLSFKATGFTSVPDGLKHLSLLKKLTLKRCVILSLPESFGLDVGHVERMNLMDCGLESLPFSFSKLTLLKHLHLSGNPLEQLPDWFGASFPDMEDLYLGTCNLSEFPVAIRGFRKLRTLNLFRNSVGNIPSWISELEQLEEVQMSRCSLSNLPDSFTCLIRLRILLLEGNQLSQLPINFNKDSFPRLRWLNLCDNQLVDLPESIAQMDIRHIELKGNPLTRPPVAMCGTIEHIRTWFVLWGSEETQKQSYGTTITKGLASGV